MLKKRCQIRVFNAVGIGIVAANAINPAVQGSAGTAGNAQGQELAIRTCEEPLGTMALVERQDSFALAQYGLESPIPMLRLMAAQSGCFAVVEHDAPRRRAPRRR